jgi:hypothetical protein
MRSFSKESFGGRVWRLKSRSAATTPSSLESSASWSPTPLPATMAMRWGHRFFPFLPPLAPFLAPLMVALVGTAQSPLAAASALPRTKAAPTTFSPEVCRVAMSSSSLVVFGCSWPSS